MSDKVKMTTSRPYLIRAIYEWIIDNGLTPHVLVNAEYPETEVPQRFVRQGQIILNIAPKAVGELTLGNHSIFFDTKFSGIIEHITMPVRAIQSIYAAENGRGMIFEEDHDEDHPPEKKNNESKNKAKKTKRKKNHLKVIK